MRDAEAKLMTVEQAVGWRERLRQAGRLLVVTNGCFDLLHRGHADYLMRARALGDALLVAVNGDASIRAIKGPDRPVVNEQDRAFMLACLESTDAVVLFRTPKPMALLRAVAPDLYVKGGDYTEETIDREEHALLKSMGCRFHFLPFVGGLSTTEMIRRIKVSDC